MKVLSTMQQRVQNKTTKSTLSCFQNSVKGHAVFNLQKQLTKNPTNIRSAYKVSAKEKSIGNILIERKVLSLLLFVCRYLWVFWHRKKNQIGKKKISYGQTSKTNYEERGHKKRKKPAAMTQKPEKYHEWCLNVCIKKSYCKMKKILKCT
jgi:hypothetical protein